MPTADTEIYLEVLEGFLGRKGLSVAHHGDNDTDSRGFRESFQTTSKTVTQPLSSKERMPIAILSSQTPQTIPPDTVLPLRR